MPPWGLGAPGNGAMTRGLGRQDYPDWGFTSLHLAAQRGDAEAIKVLLDAGANMEAKDVVSTLTLGSKA